MALLQMTLELEKTQKEQQTKQGNVHLKNMATLGSPQISLYSPILHGANPGANQLPLRKKPKERGSIRLGPGQSGAFGAFWCLCHRDDGWQHGRWHLGWGMMGCSGVVGIRGGGRVAMGLRLGFGVVTLL